MHYAIWNGIIERFIPNLRFEQYYEAEKYLTKHALTSIHYKIVQVPTNE